MIPDLEKEEEKKKEKEEEGEWLQIRERKEGMFTGEI